MPTKKIVIILIAVIAIGILVPVFLLTMKTTDTTPPTIQILSPISTTYIVQYININFSTSDSDVDTIWYRIYGNTAGSWIDPTNITWTSLSQRTLSQDGSYTLYVWANDTVGNIANAKIISFTINALPPTLSILSPINTTYFSQTTQMIINLNCPDSDVDMIWYRLYNETDEGWVDPINITWISSTQKTLSQGGVYTLYAWANDTVGHISKAVNITFTMIHEIIYSGNHVFTSTFTVDTYQKVIFQNGEFSFTSGTLIIKGILEMCNITWTSSLTIDADSALNVTNVTFNNQFRTFGNLIASFNNVTFSTDVRLYENSSVSVTDTVFNDFAYAYDSTKLTITNSWLLGLDFLGNSEVNMSYCTCSSWGYVSDYSSVILRNFTLLSGGIELWGNASLALINSTLGQLYRYIMFNSGNFLVDHNAISGTGTYTEPTATVIDSTITTIYTPIYIYSTSNILFNNSIYEWIYAYDDSNTTLYNTTLFNFVAYGSSNATILNSTCSSLQFHTNGTIYLENVTSYNINHGFELYQGNISGYNETFIGAESWRFPKITIGPKVIYTIYSYQYSIYNQVNFTLTNTSQVSYINAFTSSNVSIYYCNMPNVYMYVYQDVNITFYYSYIYHIRGYSTTNVTLFNSTCNRAYLYDSSFVSIIAESHINELYLYDDASYYLSPDSTIDNIH